MIQELLLGLDSDKARIRYGAAKALRQCSVQDPAEVYPHFDRFLTLMEGDNTFLRWGSERILGNLAAVDRENKFEDVLDRFLAPVTGHEMIGAANVMAAAAQIACAKPHLSDRIARESVEGEPRHIRHAGMPECGDRSRVAGARPFLSASPE